MNPGNMGMYTVDRAIYEIFGLNGGGGQIFCAHPPFKPGYYKLKNLGLDIGLRQTWREGLIKKTAYRDPRQLDGFHHVVFWGDFTLNPVYSERDFVEYDLRFGLSETAERATERWRALFSTSTDRPCRFMTVGQNFLHASLAQGGDHHSAAQSVLAGLSAAFPRDSESTRRVQSLNLPHCETVRGCDAALLKIGQEDPSSKDDYFVHYFYRSQLANADEIVATLEQKFGLRAVALSGWTGVQDRYERRWQDFRSLIKGARFMLTDMYHCAINAITLSTIPVVVTNADHAQTGTLGDYKKHVLLKDLELSDCLFTTDAEHRVQGDALEALVQFAGKLRAMSTDDIMARLAPARAIATDTEHALKSIF